MIASEQRNHARAFLQKAEEYLGSAGDNLVAGRNTPAAGDAIHSGISARGRYEHGAYRFDEQGQ